jgi:hypothetical protein
MSKIRQRFVQSMYTVANFKNKNIIITFLLERETLKNYQFFVSRIMYRGVQNSCRVVERCINTISHFMKIFISHS